MRKEKKRSSCSATKKRSFKKLCGPEKNEEIPGLACFSPGVGVTSPHLTSHRARAWSVVTALDQLSLTSQQAAGPR